MDESSSISERIVRLAGNQPLRLSGSSSLWVLRSGAVALFAVGSGAEAAPRRRRFLFSCGAGAALWALPRREADDRPEVVAVALEPTELNLVTLPASIPAGDELAERWIGSWIACLGPLEKPEQGTDLGDFHERVLDRLARIGTAEPEEEFKRFRERERHSNEQTWEALGELASVMQEARPVLPRGAGLYVAAHAVGRASGVELRRPTRRREGIDPVEQIAEASHVRLREVLLHDGWWREECGPLLAFVGKEHRPIGLLPGRSGAYEHFDPRSGTRRPLDDAMLSELEPRAYQFYRPLPTDATSGWQLIKFALSGRGRDLWTLLLTGAAATLLGMFTPQATALLVDRAIPDADPALLWQLALGLTAAVFGGTVFRLSQGIAMIRIETTADSVTQSAVWDRLLNLQLSFFRKFSTGDLASRVTAISEIRAYLSGTTLRTLFSSVILLLNLGLLLYYSPSLTLVALVVALLSGALTIGSGVMILNYYRQILELRGRFFGLMVQLINGVAKLRVAAAEPRAFARWASAYSGLLRLELGQRVIQDGVQVINLALSTLSAIALFALAATLVRGESGTGLSTGVFLAFHVAYGTFIGAIVSLSDTVTDVMAIAILRERARPILEAIPEISERKTDPGLLEGRLSMDHVVFHYTEDGPRILDGMSLTAEPGEFVALVGRSGSGKSTLVRLLLGFETPQSGAIYYDGQDLAGLDVYSVRRQMGVVLQNGRINAGSLFDNIACGTQVTLNDAWNAARAVGFADEITAMPMGLHTVISEGGTNLSGGQRQRLLLSRALVHKPRMLLLDEATSALDNQTQAVVTESLSRLDVTRLVIAHRLSTIRRASRIYVIEAGRIIEQGSFDDLSRETGLFARLMSRQMT